MTKNILLIIDADAIAYICSKDTLEESLLNVDSLLQGMFNATNCTMAYLFLSKGPYFRHEVNLDYKKGRSTELLFIREIKNYLKTKYKAQEFEKLEADDLVAYVKHGVSEKYKDEVKIICASTDKDVFNQIEGDHYDYKKSSFKSTTSEQADYFLALQVLTGDSVDNIKGIPGIGPKKAEKILQLTNEHDSLIDTVFKAYVTHFGLSEGVIEFQKNFRQVYLLKVPRDFINEVGYIPNIQPPLLL